MTEMTHRNRAASQIMTLLSLALLVPLFLCSGCVSLKQPSQRIDYYTLAYDAPRQMTQEVLPVILQVQRFSASPEYSTDKIIYQQADFARSAYTYHRWRATPADLATYFTTRDLQVSGFFQAVMPPNGLEHPTHILEGTVDHFLEEDSPEGWTAHIQITCTLLKNGEADVSKRVLFQHPFTAAVKCEKKHPQAVVQAMSLAMAEISTQLASYTADALR